MSIAIKVKFLPVESHVLIKPKSRTCPNCSHSGYVIGHSITGDGLEHLIWLECPESPTGSVEQCFFANEVEELKS